MAKDIPDPEAYAKAKGLTVAATVRCGDVAGLDVITGNGVWTLYLYSNNNADTEYTVTAGFEVGEDGVLKSFSVGVYNDENEFGAVEYVEPDMYYSDGTYCF